MTWFMAGAAALSVGTSYLSAQSAASSQAKAAGAASRAEGEAIAKERLNATIRNSYSTALAQVNLALKKRQLGTQAIHLAHLAQERLVRLDALRQCDPRRADVG